MRPPYAVLRKAGRRNRHWAHVVMLQPHTASRALGAIGLQQALLLAHHDVRSGLVKRKTWIRLIDHHRNQLSAVTVHSCSMTRPA